MTKYKKVGVVVAMPGSGGGFTMSAFEAKDVPVGTELFCMMPQIEWTEEQRKTADAALVEHRAGMAPADQRQRFEAWADDQGFPLKRLDTSDGYLDLRTHGAWDAWQAATDGVLGDDRG